MAIIMYQSGEGERGEFVRLQREEVRDAYYASPY